MKKFVGLAFLFSAVLCLGCDEAKQAVCGNGEIEPGESCDGEMFLESCQGKWPGADDVQDVCTAACQAVCAVTDMGWQTAYRDVEQTDEQCSNGLNDFKTVDKNGNISNWFDCNNYGCVLSPVVQVCRAIENSNETCSDHIDNPTSAKLPKGMQNMTNGLTDCQDPSCFKNPRVTVCAEQTPKWEFGAECGDNIDNDGDTLADCIDPDCLHAGGICELGQIKRILFDNAHHQIAGSADWIIDVTGRHPYPSKPASETDWHGTLSSWGKDLIDSGRYVLETLIQNREFSYQKIGAIQDLSQYHVVISVEPSSKYTLEESQALYQYVQSGGGLILFADHKGADRDGNNVDAVDAINDLLKNISLNGDVSNNPFGFSVAENSSMNNDTAVPASGQAEHPIIKGLNGTVGQIGTYAGTVFNIHGENAVAVLTTQSSGLAYVVAASVGQGRVVAIGDSSMAGDASNMLGLPNEHDAYHQTGLDNKIFLLNIVDWAAGLNVL